MTETIAREDDAASVSQPTNGTAPTPENPRRRAIGALRFAIENTDPGTVAKLRRMDASDPPAAFYRLSVGPLDELLATEQGEWRNEAEKGWAVIVGAMARGIDFLDAYTPFGAALARAGVAESRVIRLLEARREQLPELVRHAVQQLVQKGQSWSPHDLADLVLARDDNREPRRRIARGFYRHTDRKDAT